ncbi:putative Ig domain-containing protein [Methyloglobulus sp.]|uniref:putative Ig domain-containing protein n=1 Tax=Methyloglobulus sp. TaxID=2518622 RepID=UPI0032B78D68
MKKKITRSLLASAVALACGNALGAEYWLCAGTFNKTMPDGSVVQMWGYADVSNITTYPGNVCPANGDSAYTAPGPQLNVAVGDASLTVHLQNTLAEPTSLVIPGQTESLSLMAPVMVGNRVQSFTHEAAAAAGVTPGADTYTWGTTTNPLKPGSYAYQTGTHPAKQVQMGLYGAMVKDEAANSAYPGISYDTQVVEFLSEIDPVMHERVANGLYGLPCADLQEQKANPCTSTIGYNPKWFLVNGNVFVDPSPAAPATIPAGNGGTTTLIRFINMGLRSHSMILQGASMKVVAEDGHVLPVPHDQYSLMIPAGKTHDALFTPATPGVYPLYERMHNLSVADTTGIKAGGLMSFLEVATTNTAPVAANDVFAGTEDQLTAITGNVLSNDTPSTGLTVVPSSALTGCQTFSLAANGDFSCIPASNVNGQLSFTYQADNGTPPGNLSNVATVAINIAAVNDAPTITSTPVLTATEDASYTDAVAATDVDAGQSLSYSLVTAPSGMTINATSGAISWTPTNAQVGGNNVTVKVTDSSGAVNNSATQDFIVAVTNTNDAPTLNFIPAQNAVVDTAFNLNAVGSDIDAGDVLTYSITGNPTWLSINPTTGVLSGTPDAVASSTVTVTVTDTFGPVAASQNFNLDVTAVAATPVVYFSTLGNTNPTGLAGTADDADIYSWNGAEFTRVVDMSTKGLPSAANTDELKIIDATHFYLSFVADTTLPGLGTVQDEDIVYYNGTSWTLFFDGTSKGLTNANHDIDAFDIAGNTVYFSTFGSTNTPGATNPPGVVGTADNADIYSWDGSVFSRVVDLSTLGVSAAPRSGAASNVDGLKFIDSTHFYVSFAGNVTLPVIGQVQDEDIVYYDGTGWSVYFDGTAAPKTLTIGNLDVDGFDIKPLP